MIDVQQDYLRFYLFLKSNSRRGVNALRSILADGTQAKAFAENPAAVAVVLSYDKENPDKNAVELYNLLTKSSVSDTASLTYLCNTYGVTSFAELFANSEVMAKVIADDTSMSAITASRTAMESIVSDEEATANVAASETALCAIAGSALALEIALENETLARALESNAAAMSIILSTETSWAVFEASDLAMSVMRETDVALGMYIASNASLDCTAYADFTTIMADQAAFQTVLSINTNAEFLASSAYALNRIVKSSSARSAWMAGSYAHAHYETVYGTLHNAPSSLFRKYETYYGTPVAGETAYYGHYTKQDGSLAIVSDWYLSTYSGQAYPDEAVEFAGVSLFPGNSCTGTWQTKVWAMSGKTLVASSAASTDKLVCMGGLVTHYYYTDSSGSGAYQTKYATYVAV